MGEPLLVCHEKALVIAALGFTVGFAVTATAEFVQRAMSVTRALRRPKQRSKKPRRNTTRWQAQPEERSQAEDARSWRWLSGRRSNRLAVRPVRGFRASRYWTSSDQLSTYSFTTLRCRIPLSRFDCLWQRQHSGHRTSEPKDDRMRQTLSTGTQRRLLPNASTTGPRRYCGPLCGGALKEPGSARASTGRISLPGRSRSAGLLFFAISRSRWPDDVRLCQPPVVSRFD